jgi:cytoskeleton protein RodZ
MTDIATDGVAEPSLSGSDLVTIGRKLATARESLGLSVADVARQIKLSVPQVEALEADNLARLPKSPVIVKGFIRNYAKLVQLDPDVLLGRMQAAPESGVQAKARFRPQELTPDRPNRSWLGVLGLALLVAVLLGGYEFYMNPDLFGRPEEDRSAAAPRTGPSQSLPGSQSNAAEEQPAPQTSAAPTIESQATAAAAQSAAVGVAPALTAGGLPLPPTAAAASGPGIVQLKFDRDAWVEIKDRDGIRIMNQLGKSGTEKSVQGIPPLQLVIGAASGVKVKWNDQPVDIVPYTKVDVARFSLE